MTGPEQARFQELLTPNVTPAFLLEMYGLDWAPSAPLVTAFARWQATQRRPACVPSDLVNRHELESFVQSQRLLPQRWAAAQLGMDEQSLSALLAALPRLGVHRTYRVHDLVEKEITEDLGRYFPSLKFRVFSSHRDFCSRLHDAIQTDLNLTIAPLYCATSLELNDDPRWFAHDFDCITLQPVSLKHQVWLEFGKPANLPPDRCSKLYFAQNYAALSQYVAGHRDPDDLQHYTAAVEPSK